MKILHRYILSQLVYNVLYSIMVFTFLFLTIDFIDRIDNVLEEGAGFLLITQYFLLKIPYFVTLVTPISMLIGTLFTVGLLSKNSELTAMRASGATVLWLMTPVLTFGIFMSFFSMCLEQVLVPHTQRRVREIYNIDIRKKDKRGGYSRNNFWWRQGNTFYSAGMFDSRSDTLHDLLILDFNKSHLLERRVDANHASFLTSALQWSMENVIVRDFKDNVHPEQSLILADYPLLIERAPQEFYDAETDPYTMNFFALKEFITAQEANGIDTHEYLADLYNKLAFPFAAVIIPLVVLTFAMKPARSGSMASSIVASLFIGFSYYAIQSFFIALGRAELLPPLFAAWTTNIIFLFVGLTLLSGAENQ